MQFSEAWLRTMVDPPIDVDALCHQLTMAGLEVEGLRPAGPPFDAVVVAQVLAVEPHPDADRLRVCRVDSGEGKTRAVVCGAPNVRAGQKVPCALPGATLPSGVTIRTTTVRGVHSAGMLCSAAELGLSEDASGLLVLPADAPVGAPLREFLALDDALVTLKLTPNRGDCLSILGIAREVGALNRLPVELPDWATLPASDSVPRREVRIDEAQACPRFCARVIRGIDARAPTPHWMKQRLERSGIRSISAVVDVTNYVMLELGQPLHAYDDRILEGAVVVRYPRPGETLTLLNGQVLALDSDMLLVCDEAKPLGLAGIMGGEHSGIGEATVDVFLEGAFWSPDVIQGRSRRLGFTSDAGHRFERGVDFANTPAAVERATRLIVDICGGAAAPLIDVTGPLPLRSPVDIRRDRIARLLGVEIAPATAEDILRRLGLGVEPTASGWRVTPPSYRFDLVIEEDIVEEVARVHGYDNISAEPARHLQRMLRSDEARLGIWNLRDRIVGRDYQEVITFSFVDSRWETDFADNAEPIRVQNPIASHLDVMRSTLAGSLVEVLRTNVARKHPRVRIFEVGRCFLRDGDEVGFRQPLRLGMLAYGPATDEQWGERTRPVDLFDVKGDLQALVAARRLETVAARHPALHPGRSARVLIDGRDIGWIGELHPRLVGASELPAAPILAELELAPLLSTAVPRALPVSKLPPVRRDIAVLVDETVPVQRLLSALDAGKPEVVVAVTLFDVYRGTGLPQGKKSVAILVLMQHTERTLTEVEIEENVARLIRLLEEQFGAILRQ